MVSPSGDGLDARAFTELGGKYLRSDEIRKAKPRTPRGSKLQPFHGYIRQRLTEGVDNCVLSLRELQERGYTGGDQSAEAVRARVPAAPQAVPRQCRPGL